MGKSNRHPIVLAKDLKVIYAAYSITSISCNYQSNLRFHPLSFYFVQRLLLMIRFIYQKGMVIKWLGQT